MKYAPVQNFIGGQFITPVAATVLEVISPVDGSLLSTVPMSAAHDLDTAVQAAKKAFAGWSRTPIKERVQVFFRYKNLLETNLQELAALCSEDNGKSTYDQEQRRSRLCGVAGSLRCKLVLISRDDLALALVNIRGVEQVTAAAADQEFRAAGADRVVTAAALGRFASLGFRQ